MEPIKSRLPLLERKIGLGPLIVSFRETRIELDCVLKLNAGFLVFARLQITLSAFEVLDLPLLGVKRTATQHDEQQENQCRCSCLQSPTYDKHVFLRDPMVLLNLE